MNIKEKNEDCCAPFDPNPWEEKGHKWVDKMFIKDCIPQFLHLPLPGTYKRVITRLNKLALDASATTDKSEFLLLSHDPSPWKSHIYLSVTHEVPGADNVKISGNFVSKVFNGPYSKIPQYIRDMDIYLSKQNKLAVKHYIFLTTCPKCARKYGYNYIVVFAEV